MSFPLNAFMYLVFIYFYFSEVVLLFFMFDFFFFNESIECVACIVCFWCLVISSDLCVSSGVEILLVYAFDVIFFPPSYSWCLCWIMWQLWIQLFWLEVIKRNHFSSSDAIVMNKFNRRIEWKSKEWHSDWAFIYFRSISLNSNLVK